MSAATEPSPRLPLALLLGLALAAGLALDGPSLLAPTTSAPATRFTDGQFINLALGAAELPWPTHTDRLGWPAGAGFAPLLWPWLPVTRLLGPTLALNLLFVAFPVFNAACGWVAARRLGAGPWSAFVTGLLCTFHLWGLNTLSNGQLEQVPVGAAAMAWAAAWRALGSGGAPPGEVGRGEGSRWALSAGLWVAGTALAAPHVGLATLVGLGVVLLVGAPRAWRSGGRGTLVLLVALVGLGAGLAHAWHGPQFQEGASVFAPKGAVASEHQGRPLPGIFDAAGLGDLLLPTPPPAPQAQGVVHSAYLGWTALLSAVAAVLAARRGRGRPARPGLAADSPDPTDEGTPPGETTRSGGAAAAVPAEAAPAALAPAALWLGVALVLAVAALGDHVRLGPLSVPLPPALYGALSSALARSANPYRLVSGAVVALALAGGSAARGPRSAALITALLALELGLVANRPVPLPSQAWAPAASSVALAAGRGPVLDLPLATPACPDVGWRYAREAMWHGRPIPLTLRFDWRAWGAEEGRARKMARALESPDCGARLGALVREAGYTAVVTHRDVRCPPDPRARNCLTEAFGAPTDGPDEAWWTVGPPP